ncbi:chaperone NapD [Collimonas sp. NPDC087041]|uniref:chaperone NapD n=1 Tax=Collimonas sp. NPDC087041 TaxID=3363960 RepID=UPI00382D0B7F
MGAINRKIEGETDSVSSWYVVGAVIHAQHDRLIDVSRMLSLIPNAEIHSSSDLGKLAVILKGRSEYEVIRQVKMLYAMQGVFYAAVVRQCPEHGALLRNTWISQEPEYKKFIRQRDACIPALKFESLCSRGASAVKQTRRYH